MMVAEKVIYPIHLQRRVLIFINPCSALHFWLPHHPYSSPLTLAPESSSLNLSSSPLPRCAHPVLLV